MDRDGGLRLAGDQPHRAVAKGEGGGVAEEGGLDDEGGEDVAPDARHRVMLLWRVVDVSGRIADRA